MSAKEFFTAIGMLDTYNRIMNISPDTKKTTLMPDLDTRELGRYKSYVFREKLLKREILELTQSRIRVEKLLQQGGEINLLAQQRFKRSRSDMIDLWIELSKVMLKKRELENRLEQIRDPFVKQVVQHRYFESPDQRLHTWAQTASELGIPMTGVQLRGVITKALDSAIL